MALTMNKESMNSELNKLLTGDERYKAKTWATIQTSTPKLLTYCTEQGKRPKIGSSHIYCYVGLTESFLNIVTLLSLDVTKTTGSFRIPLKDIEKADVKSGLLKCSAVLDFGQEKIKILWVNQASGTDLKEQRKNVKVICDYLKD